LSGALGTGIAGVMLLLVVGGCGDDDARQLGPGEVAPDASEGSDSDADPALEEGAGDDPWEPEDGAWEPEDDAATPEEDAAVATIAQDAGESARDAAAPRADVDTGAERITRVATDFCKVAFGCDASMARKVWGNEALCRRELEGLWKSDLELYGAGCADAQLDLHHCYAAATCEEQLTGCATEEDDVARVCPSI
jgi:hypothetical protein